MAQLAGVTDTEVEVTNLAPITDAGGESKVGEISQTQLMVRRFKRSKLAVTSLIILIVMYICAIVAPFLAPTDPASIDQGFKFAKPSSWTWNGGPAICPTIQKIDPVNISTVYQTDCSKAIPVHFFGKGFEYKLFGVVPTDRHLLTVDKGRLLIFGADGNGRDIFSRMIYGARISMTIGLIG